MTIQALVIDDDLVCRMVLARLLAGCAALEVVEAADGEAAWRLMTDGMRPVLCCCDVQMPGMSGLELLQRMKATPALAQIPVVLVSAATDLSSRQQALTLGAAAYLCKPLQAADARAHLGRLLEKAMAAMVETPGATLERLNISAARLLAYLNAYAGQVRAQTAPLTALLADGGQAAARTHIAALQKGGQTLGLWQTADALAQLGRGEIGVPALQEALAQAAAAAAAQAAAVTRAT